MEWKFLYLPKLYMVKSEYLNRVATLNIRPSLQNFVTITVFLFSGAGEASASTPEHQMCSPAVPVNGALLIVADETRTK